MDNFGKKDMNNIDMNADAGVARLYTETYFPHANAKKGDEKWKKENELSYGHRASNGQIERNKST